MVAHKLPRFSKTILDKPQLIHPTKYAEIADILDNRGEYLKLRKEASDLYSMKDDFEVEGGGCSVPSNVGVLNIDGPLTARANFFQALCGGASYEALITETEELIAEGKECILMHVSSPGGEAFKMFSSANRIKKLCKDNNVKLIAYVDNQAASAAYGLSVVADEIISHPESSCIGSVGVIVSMMDNSKELENKGLRRVLVSAGANKHPFNEDGSFKDSFLEDTKLDIDKLYSKFVKHVAVNRNMSEDKVIETEASTYPAEEAMEMGFVDKLMEEPELYDYLKSLTSDEQSPELKTTPQKEKLMSDPAEMSELEALKAELSALKTEKAQAETEAREAELTASLADATYLSNVEGVVGFLMSADEAQTTLLNTVLADASAALSKQETESEAALAEATSKFTTELSESQEKLSKVEEEKEALKSEFAKPDAIRGEEAEENLQALSHKEKLARAVETAKAKQNA